MPEGRQRRANAAVTTFAESFLAETAAIVAKLDRSAIERLAAALAELRDGGGRLFVLGVGGSASYALHLAADVRNICQIEAYTPVDNVSELTARINDEGWETSFANWLRASRLGESDGLLILSVGGGDREKNVSVNLVKAIELAKQVGARVFGIVGRDGGFTAASRFSPAPGPQGHQVGIGE
ncbi:MAG: hypothetical protein AUG48_00320 [Actinobacteria bacterium 13_1_20CM_3_68_9]|nr:MAG: hypothetical protein AUG48_00320 [Actinobacteria bacterium 13_1_20CM_3_68_9]